MDKKRDCPLCMEQLEMDDLNFFPCKCGYQICRFCWHRIRTNENGLCPHCRRHFPENPANFKPLTPEEFQQLKNKKKQKDLKKKQKISECRKQLANIRVVQKNLVFVVGLPLKLVDASESEKASLFKQFGKIQKLIVNTNTTYAGSQGPSSCAYVTYYKPQEAYSAVHTLNNTKMEGRNIKASLGTTKYCSNFLKKLHCPKQDCMYLHEIAESAASFTKEQIQLGKHLEYEQKLYEQMSTNQNHNRKESSCSELTDSDDSLHKDKEISTNATQDQSKESFQSSSDHVNSIANFTQSNQIIQNQDHAKHPTNHISDQDQNSMFLHCGEAVPSTQAKTDPQQQPPRTDLPCDTNSHSFFSNFSPMGHNRDTTSSQGPLLSNNTVRSQVLEFQSRNASLVEAKPTENGPNPAHMRWMMNGQQVPEKKSAILALLNGSSEDHLYDGLGSPSSGSSSSFAPTRNSSRFFSSISPSSHSSYENFNHVHKPTHIPFPPFSTNGDVFGENIFRESQDDDLGFDPCKESLEGLKDLISKEEEEAARVIYSSSMRSTRPVMPKAFPDRSSDVIGSRNSFYTPQRFTNPPPGFSQGSSLHNVPFANVNLASNRVQSIRSQFPSNRLSQHKGLNGLSPENRVSLLYEAFEPTFGKSANSIRQNSSSTFSQPPFPNAGQIPHSSWTSAGQVNSSIKPLENSFHNQSFLENRYASPLHHLQSLQQSFNELSMRQLQQNGVKHDSSLYTDQLYATLLRNLQTGYPNGS